MPTILPTPTPAAAATLERNLGALAGHNRGLAQRVRGTPAREGVAFVEADDGALAVQIGAGRGARALCSRRRPLEEAERFAEGADVKGHGCVVIAGFGAGHHAGAVARRLGRAGVLVIFEPDVGLLRAVLERIDHTAWMRGSNVVVLTDADAGSMSGALGGAEPVLALGVTLLEHAASKERLEAHGGVGPFYAELTRLVESVRTTVVTTMVQAAATLRNTTQNLGHYLRAEGVAGLAGAAAGRPAVVVSAGPSLGRNMALLARPGVRDRVVIVAVQTVLKPLLAAGIRPHYVTALDHHEISRRFYEGLTARDVEGVTLIAEPKANPVILDAFPGTIRCPAEGTLDALLGAGMAREMGALPAGATVAHLAYYFARHLGCDPVILIGQDLGFTDGQYYGAGAAIHGVWAGELNAFNTIEMLEWERIVRMRPHLKRVTDTLGRSIYTDEQMATYLVQFQREFKADADRGLATIDATEGGVAKGFTTAMTLRAALERHAGEGSPGHGLHEGRAGAGSGPGPGPGAAGPSAERAMERVRSVRRDAGRVAALARATGTRLAEMVEHHADQRRVNGLIATVQRLAREAEALQPAYGLAAFINQTGGFNRAKADRAIHFDEGLSPLERQRRQIGRDLENVRWLGDAAEELGRILDDAAAALGGAPKRTREGAGGVGPREGGGGGSAAVTAVARPARVAALIPLLRDRSGLGVPRDIELPFLHGKTPLRLTLERLAASARVDGVVLLTPDPAWARSLLGGVERVGRLPVEVEAVDGAELSERSAGVRAARLWADGCWRGGLGNLTVYDETLHAPAMARAMGARGIDAALLLGPEWCLVDPALCNAVIDRHRERPGTNRLVFTQAAPGLAPALVSRSLMDDLARAWRGGAHLASIGALTGYLPAAPVPDLIATGSCVAVDPAVRDAPARFIPDSDARRSLLAGALERLGGSLGGASAAEIAAMVTERTLSGGGPEAPAHAVLELCTGRRTGGRRAHWERGSVGCVERPPMTLAGAERLLGEIGAARSDAAVTLGGIGDPLLHPDCVRVVLAARRAGIAAVHVRTDGLADHGLLDELFDAGPDVISIDLMAGSAEAYRSICGVDRYADALGAVEHLLARRRRAAAALGAAGGNALATPWIVPRMTRCDAAYAEVEGFFDRWMVEAGWAVIDPLPVTIPGDRIVPFPKPVAALRKDWRKRMTIYSDGCVPAREKDAHGLTAVGNALRDGVPAVWKRLCRHRAAALRESGPGHPDLEMGP